MADPLRMGVLGCGRIGRMHAELLAGRVRGARLTRVYDLLPDVAASTAATYGAAVAESAHDLIGAADVDAVAICTSTDTHVELIEAAAAAAKPIFCEKPVTQELAAIDRAAAAVTAAGITFHVGFNRRFDPSHRAVHDAVAAGEVGDVHLVRITSRDPEPPPIDYITVSGGIFLDMTIHDFDMARFITGSEVETVYATGGVLVDEAIGEAGDIDTAVVVLNHANGAITSIDNSRRTVYGYDQRVEAFGSAGMAGSDNPLQHTTVRHSAAGAHRPALPHFFLDRYLPSYLAQWEDFVVRAAAGQPASVDMVDGRAPLVMGLAAARSLAEGRPVTLAEVG